MIREDSRAFRPTAAMYEAISFFKGSSFMASL